MHSKIGVTSCLSLRGQITPSVLRSCTADPQNKLEIPLQRKFSSGRTTDTLDTETLTI